MSMISLVWGGLRPIVMIAVVTAILFMVRATAATAVFAYESQRIEQLRADRAQFDRDLKYYAGDF